MKRDVIILKCQNCGEEFLYDYRGSGAKPRYCDKCRDIITKESIRKWKEKVKEKKLEEQPATAKSDAEFDGFVERISTSFMALDTIRVELCELAKQMSEYQSGYDKNDQSYLHQLEQLDVEDVSKTTAFIKEWKNSRNNRRNTKDLLALVGKVIDAIPYKNYANALPTLKSNTYFHN